MPCDRRIRRCWFFLVWLCAADAAAQQPQAEGRPDAIRPAISADAERAPPTDGSLPLKPRSQPGNAELRRPSGVASSLSALAGSLAIVLGLFFLIAWLLRRGMPKGSSMLPSEVVEVLGRAPLAGRQQMHLVRCGNKLLLVSVSGGGAETLTEITEPEEVDRLAGLCRAAHPHSATASFRHVLQQFGREPASAELRGPRSQGPGTRKGIGPSEDLDD